MSANHKTAHIDNVRERKAARRALEAEAGPITLENAIELTTTEEEAVEGDGDDGAQSEPQASDSAESESETDTQGLEKPMTFGSI